MSKCTLVVLRVLLVLCLVGSLAGLVQSTVAAPVSIETGEDTLRLIFDERSSDGDTGPVRDQAVEKTTPEERDKRLHFDFPKEGPESAATAPLADTLSWMAIWSLLEPLARLATASEVVDKLTHSLYTTMVMVGTVVFGVGLLVLAWKVYHSVREAAVSEPVTFSFLCTIPGLRYLMNHIRYHLWDMPLAPRRRFASFVGASGSHADLLELEEDRPAADGRGRRESLLRHHESFSSLSSTGSSAGSNGRTRRKSMLKPAVAPSSSAAATTTAGSISRQSKLAAAQEIDMQSLRKRHSVAITTPPASVKQVSSSSGSPSPVPEAGRRGRMHSAETIFEEMHAPDKTEGGEAEQEHVVELAIPAPRSVSIVPQLLEQQQRHEEYLAELEVAAAAKRDENIEGGHGRRESPRTERARLLSLQPVSNAYVTPAESTTSGTASRRSSLTASSSGADSLAAHSGDEHPHRSWTPLSGLSSEQELAELNKRRADWVRNMPLFNNDYSFLPPEVKEVAAANPAVATTAAESKLSRRLGGAPASVTAARDVSVLERSKLSRYFADPAPIPSATAQMASTANKIPLAARGTRAYEEESDTIAKKIYEGDLTPPPGFARRHSASLASRPAAVASSPLEESHEAGDQVTLGKDYHAAFLSASQRGRRASSLMPSRTHTGQQQRSAAEEGRSGTTLYERRRVSSALAQGDEGNLAMPSWRWFMGEADGGDGGNGGGGHSGDSWDPNIARPHSIDVGRAHPAPVGSGSRSAGRATPENVNSSQQQASRKNDPSAISLGIFDDIFSRG